jgi:carbon storage regulator CsrA
MLVLSRKQGQELVLGDNVRVTVTKISGNRVTLGITAPDNVRIIRGELESIVKSFDQPVSELEVVVEADDEEPSSQFRSGFVLRHGGPLADVVNHF